MKAWIAFWNIVAKDFRAYYLKPPNVSWGLIFPLAWTGMFFVRSGAGLDSGEANPAQVKIPAVNPNCIMMPIHMHESVLWQGRHLEK